MPLRPGVYRNASYLSARLSRISFFPGTWFSAFGGGALVISCCWMRLSIGGGAGAIFGTPGKAPAGPIAGNVKRAEESGLGTGGTDPGGDGTRLACPMEAAVGTGRVAAGGGGFGTICACG